MKITLEKQLANKKYYREHKEQICSKRRKYYREHKEQICSKKRKQYYEKCKSMFQNLKGSDKE